MPARRCQRRVSEIDELAADRVGRQRHAVRVGDLVRDDRLDTRRVHRHRVGVVAAHPVRIAGRRPDSGRRVALHRYQAVGSARRAVVELERDGSCGRCPYLQARPATLPRRPEPLSGGATIDVIEHTGDLHTGQGEQATLLVTRAGGQGRAQRLGQRGQVDRGHRERRHACQVRIPDAEPRGKASRGRGEGDAAATTVARLIFQRVPVRIANRRVPDDDRPVDPLRERRGRIDVGPVRGGGCGHSVPLPDEVADPSGHGEAGQPAPVQSVALDADVHVLPGAGRSPVEAASRHEALLHKPEDVRCTLWRSRSDHLGSKVLHYLVTPAPARPGSAQPVGAEPTDCGGHRSRREPALCRQVVATVGRVAGTGRSPVR